MAVAGPQLSAACLPLILTTFGVHGGAEAALAPAGTTATPATTIPTTMRCVSPLRIKGGVLGYTWILSSTEAGRLLLACSGTRRSASHHGRLLASDDGAYLFYVRVRSFAV